MPAFLNKLSNALFKSELNDDACNITTYNHPMSLGREELSLSSLYVCLSFPLYTKGY